MNQGGESGYDDYGLPPVDVVVPDDARELYRDVQAYHRELRALRRQERSMRWRTPFRRSGVALPLIAGCLVAALVAVMVSAMFTANPYINGTVGKQPSGQADASALSPGSTDASNSRAGLASGRGNSVPPLPHTSITVAGKALPLRTLSTAALAIVPAKCQGQCASAIRELLIQAAQAEVILYLVVPRGGMAYLTRLVAGTPRKNRRPRVATDSDNVLAAKYRPMGLTVLLVDSRGSVTEDPRLGPNLKLEDALTTLRRAK